MSRYPLATVCLCTFLLFGLSFFFCWNTLQQIMTTSHQEQQRDLLHLLTADLEEAQTKGLARAELVAAMPGVGEALARQDAARLRTLVGPIFDVQRKKYGVAQGNFCTSANHMLLRLQNPSAPGDDVSGYRHLVVHTNETGEVHSGVEMARSGPQIFGVAPVFAGSKQVGTFDIGMSFESRVEQLHARHGVEVAAVFERKLLEQVASLQKWDGSAQNQLGDYLQVCSSDWQLLQGLLQGRRLDYLREPLSFVAPSGGQDYLVCAIPLPDLTGRFVGIYIGARALPPFRTQLRNGKITAGVICLLGLFLSWAALQLIVRGMLLAPMSELALRMQRWSQGEAPPGVGDLRQQAPALTPLLQAYEQLAGPKNE